MFYFRHWSVTENSLSSAPSGTFSVCWYVRTFQERLPKNRMPPLSSVWSRFGRWTTNKAEKKGDINEHKPYFSLILFSLFSQLWHSCSATSKWRYTTLLLHRQAHWIFWKWHTLFHERFIVNYGFIWLLSHRDWNFTPKYWLHVAMFETKCEVLDKNNMTRADAKIGLLWILRGQMYGCLLVKSFLLLDLAYRSRSPKLKREQQLTVIVEGQS